MGEMTGGIKMAESLYLKGFSPLDGRDGAFFDYNCMLSDNNARLFLDNAALFALIVPLLGTIYSHLGNIIFPAWEQNIPSVEIKHSLMPVGFITPKVIFNSLGVFSITPKVLTPTPSLLTFTLLPAVQPTAGKCPVDSREQSAVQPVR